jgi:N-carbamoyl-L-amino-acid hydrolase
VLDKSGVQIGVVEGIVGINRYHVTIKGVANHAGTTPMPDRQDALLAASRLILAVREEIVREPGQQVGTVGRLDVYPNAVNVVPGEVRLVVELRDLSMEKIERIFGRIAIRARGIATESKTEIDIRLASSHSPAPATDWVAGIIEAEARRLGSTTLRLPSGAGHDAQSMAKIVPMGMIFVPSVGGISHSPKELTRWPDVFNGAELLLRAVLAIDSRSY